MPPTSEMRFLWIFVIVVQARGDNSTSSVQEVNSTTTTSDWLSRESDGDANDVNNTDVPLDLFRWKDIDLRKHKRTHRTGRMSAMEVWDWDLYCHLQPVRGNCKQSMKRFHYDAQLDTCTEFTYSGCSGNKNNFQSIIDCERRCKGANFMGVKERSLPTICFLQPDSGLCLAFMANYYYDVNSASCRHFTYGGCGGNLNRFESIADCEEYCSKSSSS